MHSGEDVILTAAGPGSERVRGQLDNTEVFRVMVEALGLGYRNLNSSSAQCRHPIIGLDDVYTLLRSEHLFTRLAYLA